MEVCRVVRIRAVRLGHRVFLSYATEDIDSAHLICQALEATEGIRCWIAPRDVEAGADYAAAILEAIKSAHLVVLVFSASANASPYVLREIERAIAYDRPVLSVRLDGTSPNPSLEYYLNLWQWLDASGGIEMHQREIADAVRKQLGAGPTKPGPAFGPKRGPDSLSDERRLVTILRSALAGFSGVAESRDAEEVQELLNHCFDVLVPCVQRYGGTIDKFTGDGMMVLFGAPMAHENDAERAVRAALDIRATLTAFCLEQRVQLAVHQGISTGRVVAGSVGGGDRHDYSVVGDAVNIAARLEDLSAPDEILIGTDTFALAGSFFNTEDAGSVSLKGRTESLRVYRVLGEASPTRTETFARLRSPLVGRESELRVLREGLDRLSEGEGGVIYIAGDAGVGKTRLLEEGRELAGPAGWLEGRAASMGPAVSYQPIREMLQADVGWDLSENREERRAGLARRLDSLLPNEGPEALRFLSSLLGVETTETAEWLRAFEESVFRRRLHATVGRYFAQSARQQPVVLVFEDLHWVDDATATLIEELTPLVHEVPLLLCLVSRPDLEDSSFQPERIAVRAREKFHRLRLGPLNVNQSRELMARVLGSPEVPPGLSHLVEARAEGNPFFIQEILRALIASRMLEKDGTRGWRLAGRSRLSVPDTLRGVVVSRIDRLPAEARETIRVASVLGRTFPLVLLSGVAGLSVDQLGQQVRYLEDVEMLRSMLHEQEPRATFTHALIQEAVYESIPLRERRLMHQRVAETLEAAASYPEENCDLLAYHYSKAERWDRAQEYLFVAGGEARLLGSQFAGSYYRQALDALLRGSNLTGEGQDESHFLDWFIAGISPLFYQGRLSEIEEPLDELYRRTVEAFGPTDRRTLAVTEMVGGVYFEKTRWQEGVALLEAALAVRESLEGPDEPSLARLLVLLGAMLWGSGRRDDGERVLLRGIELQKTSGAPDPEILGMLYTSLGGCYLAQNEDARARASLLEAFTMPRLERTHYHCGVLTNLCESEVRLGLPDEAEYHGRLGSEWNSPYLAAFCRGNLAFALCTFGKYQEALNEARRALAAFEDLERPLDMASTLAQLAECHLQLGELDDAERAALRASSLLEEAPRVGWPGASLGAALWTLAGVELARNNLAEAERLLDESAPLIILEHPGGDPFWEAQVRFRRGQLHLKHGRRVEAEQEVSRAADLLEELGGKDHGLRKLMLGQWRELSREAVER
jgi:class 3 adenylate cyclase/tetratricopeptide (TPR) repeat protein